MSSVVFGRKSPILSHHAKPGSEIYDLRKDTDEAFEALESNGIHGQDFGQVGIQGADADGLVASIATATSIVTTTGALFDGVLAPQTTSPVIKSPKRVTITVAGGGTPAHWTGGDIVITGVDVDGDALVETVASVAGAGVTTSVGYFAGVTSIVIPAQGGTGATYTIGVAADTSCIANGTSLSTAQVLDVNSEFNRARIGNRVMDNARALSVVLGNHADWDATTMVISGFDAQGLPISENFSIPNGGSTTLTGAKYFKQVTRVEIPAQTGGSGTFAIGIVDTTVGLERTLENGAIAVVGVKELTRADASLAWSAATAGVVTAAATALPYGALTPNSAPDGTREYKFVYLTA